MVAHWVERVPLRLGPPGLESDSRPSAACRLSLTFLPSDAVNKDEKAPKNNL